MDRDDMTIDIGQQGPCTDVAQLRAERDALAVALHEGPVQNFTMLGIRLEQARARLGRGDVTEAGRALERLQAELADEISALRQLLNGTGRRAS